MPVVEKGDIGQETRDKIDAHPLASWVLSQLEAKRDPEKDVRVRALAITKRIEGLEAMSTGRRPTAAWRVRIACVDGILKDKRIVGGKIMHGGGMSIDDDDDPSVEDAQAWADEHMPEEPNTVEVAARHHDAGTPAQPAPAPVSQQVEAERDKVDAAIDSGPVTSNTSTGAEHD